MQPDGSERAGLSARTTTYATSIDDLNQAALEFSYRVYGASPHTWSILTLSARYRDVRRWLCSYHADARRPWVRISIVKTYAYEFARPAASAQLWVTVYVWQTITKPEIVGCAEFKTFRYPQLLKARRNSLNIEMGT
jgi:hypothetical protein